MCGDSPWGGLEFYGLVGGSFAGFLHVRIQLRLMVAMIRNNAPSVAMDTQKAVAHLNMVCIKG